MSSGFLIFKNLLRRKLRFFLTCFSIIIAFFIFSAATAFKEAMEAPAEFSGANRLITVNKVSLIMSMPLGYANKVAAIDGVKEVTHANWFGGYFKEPFNQIPTFAVDPESYLKVYDNLSIEPEQKNNWLKNRNGILVGESVAKQNNWQVGDQVPLSSNIFTNKAGGQTWNLEISGIFSDRSAGDFFVLMHYLNFTESNTFGMKNIGWMILTTSDASRNEAIAKTVDERFANSSHETDTSTEKAFNQAFIAQMGNISLIVGSVVFMAFFTILVLVGNTMALCIRERTKEIAVMKTLGFASSKIFTMVLVESLMLAFIGGVLGLGIAYLFISVVGANMSGLPPLTISSNMLVQAIAYMLLLGLATGILPAVQALRLNIATAFSRG